MDVDSIDSRTTADDYGSSLSIWETVNIVESPRLTGLFGALSVFECEPFCLDCSNTTGPFDLQAELDQMERSLDSKAQDEDNGSSPSGAIVRLDSPIRKPKTLFVPTWTTQDGPSIGLSPFPTPTAKSNSPSHDFASPDTVPQLSEAECMAKMPKWNKMTPAGILDLADSMESIAEDYHNHQDYHSALLWYRRVIRLKKQKRARQLRPIETISACLNVIICLRSQGAYAEAQNLHRSLHEKISVLFPDDEVAISSRDTQAWLLGDFGDLEEEEAIRRNILQIQLSKFGPTSRQGLDAMRTLGSCLTRRKAFSQSEHLIRTVIQLESQLFGHRVSEEIHLRNSLIQQVDLAAVLNGTDRYLEAEQLFGYINKVFPNLTAMEDRRSDLYHLELAETLRLQGCLAESEKIYQDFLHHHGASLDPGRRAAIMQRLAMISEQTDRGSEAVAWQKTTFDLNVKAYGLEHRYSLASCMDLGNCYARQGLFDEAMLHFEQMISKIDLARKEGDDVPNVNVEKIRNWMMEVSTDRCKATGFGYAHKGMFDDAILHFQQHIEKLVRTQMDSCSFSDSHAAEKCIEYMKRCISYVLVRQDMASCQRAGFSYVDQGQFDEAILYYQQATTKVTEAQSTEPDKNMYSVYVENLQAWMSTAYAHKYLRSFREIGQGYADQGHFDQAVQYFRQAIDEIDLTQENLSHDPKECIEILKYWIHYTEQWKAESYKERGSENAFEEPGQNVEMEEGEA